jgi:hypothetical protein
VSADDHSSQRDPSSGKVKASIPMTIPMKQRAYKAAAEVYKHRLSFETKSTQYMPKAPLCLTLLRHHEKFPSALIIIYFIY